jgi:hypothetical protein
VSEDRKRILAMLAEGKITADEAERLLDAMVRRPDLIEQGPPRSNGAPKYFRVEVNASDTGDGPAKVNVRIPMQLLRAGVRLSALIPPQARSEVNAAMARGGVPFDLSQIKPENLDELIDHLSEFTVDVDSDQAKVRVYCE